ncbi:MAG: divalent metal cation transporter [Cyclobacteriaceae bacterium]|nr:divalent metal cation transporter [Cyclobacteriaceae bacterium]
MNRSRLSSVILWSVISAAFIGPGTVTTAVSAGSQFQLQLLWAVIFATIACIVLQEVSARITIATGLSLGDSIENKFGRQKGFWIKWLVGGSVVLGCAAYEAGNILGGTAGLLILFKGNGKVYASLLALVAAWVLWNGHGKWISTIMTVLIGMMGIAFLALALNSNFTFSDLLVSSIIPSIPDGSALLILGLVGTTIVPYNLFLGSGISKGQTIRLMRIGLTISVLMGGLITIWILMAGTLVGNFTSFSELANEFQKKIGMVGVYALGIGLFAAGFSSAITSPYAASIIATSVFGAEKKSTIRIVWGIVLLIGFVLGISGVKPIPVILTVQALNGLILPLITGFLILIVNDKKLVPENARHAGWYNVVLLLILGSVLLIGLNNVDKAIVTALQLTSNHFNLVASVSVLVAACVGFLLWRK